MKNGIHIKNHAALVQRIKELEARQARQEEKMKKNFEEILQALQPKTILKTAWNNVASDPDIQRMTGKASIDIGLNYFVNKLLGSKISFKRHLSAVAIEKVTGFLLSGIQLSFDQPVKKTHQEMHREDFEKNKPS